MNAKTIGCALIPLCVAAALSATPVAHAQSMALKADLKGASEVPPNSTAGTGSVDAAYDPSSKKLTWIITYSGLTGPATAAHFHGPAAPSANAPVIVPITGDLKSPITGSAMLTDAQAKELQDGQVYFNIHTAANKGGEIRGQVVRK